MAACVHVALAPQIKLKLWENSCWYLHFGTYVSFMRQSSEKYKIVSWMNFFFEELNDFRFLLEFAL
jgi:hypothetical protein